MLVLILFYLEKKLPTLTIQSIWKIKIFYFIQFFYATLYFNDKIRWFRCDAGNYEVG